MIIGAATDDSFQIHLAWSDEILVLKTNESAWEVLLAANLLRAGGA